MSVDWTEAVIRVNGIQLTPGESMTVRCALQAFARSLEADGLGTDAHGIEMTRLYLANVKSINELLFAPYREQ